jgi:hypothetical protein
MKTLRWLYIGLLLVLTFGCKDVLVSNESVIPNVKILTISPLVVKQFQDSLTIQIAYKDGDGDLGDYSADSFSIFLRDSRLADWDRFHLPPLAPENTSVSIEGTFDLKLKNVFLLSNSNSETVYFELYLKDRSGNKSNIAQSNTITILR